jgi:hypothetical protein
MAAAKLSKGEQRLLHSLLEARPGETRYALEKRKREKE